MPCRIRAVEHRKCAAGLADAHPGLQDRILLNYIRIEIKYAKKLCYVYKSSKLLVSFFPAETLLHA